MLAIFKQNPFLLGLGLLITFFSMCGQTVVISLFNPHLIKKISLSHQELGISYGLATFLASFFPPFMGQLLDKGKIQLVNMLNLLGVTLGLTLLGLANSAPMLFLAFLIIRAFGHISMAMVVQVAISKTFIEKRGMALGIMQLGGSLGQSTIPYFIIFGLGSIGFQSTLISLILALGVCLPLSWFLIQKAKLKPQKREKKEEEEEKEKEQKGPHPVMLPNENKKKLACLFLAGSILPFIMTGLFFLQGPLAAFRERSLLVFAQGLITLTLFQIMGSLGGGHLVDKFSARFLIKFSLLPLIPGCLFLGLGEGLMSLHCYFALAGMSLGLYGNFKTAFYAEIFDPKLLGKMKGIDSTFLVWATSLAPYLFSEISARENGIYLILFLVAGICLVGSIIYWALTLKSAKAS